MRLRNVHRAGTLGLSALMVVIGVTLVIEALTGLGGLSIRLLAGVLFIAGGVGRLYVEVRRGRSGVGSAGSALARRVERRLERSVERVRTASREPEGTAGLEPPIGPQGNGASGNGRPPPRRRAGGRRRRRSGR